MRPGRFAAAAAGSALLAGTTFALAGATAGPAALASSASHAASPAVLIAPDAVHAAHALSVPPSTAYCEQHFKIACYLPGQIEQAYGLPQLYRRGITGKGQTIVIVDSFGSPTVAHDLAVFDKAAGIPAPPSLRVIQPAGKVPPYKPTDDRVGWAGETDLDVEYAHAIAPGASILLVETPTSEDEGTTGFPQIVTAEKFVISHHLGGVISQSFSATEQTFATRASLLNLRGAYTAARAAGVTVLAASGDSGAADVRFDGSTFYLKPVTSWPDSDPFVTGVGGTQLHLAGAGQPGPATVWNDTFNVPTNNFVFGSPGPNALAGGGGKSVIFSRPGYQDSVASVVGRQRGVPDISMSGACNGSADMYQSFAGQPALVPDLRHQRGHPGVRRHRRAGQPGRRPPARPDQPRAVPAVGPGSAGHRGRHQRQQHGRLPAGREDQHRGRIPRPARLRPGVRGRHGVGAAVRARACLRGQRAPVSGPP